MLELYNDNLIDLFADVSTSWAPPSSSSQKLNIKKDARGMVYVQNAVVRVVNNANELMDSFVAGNERRKTESTKMNEHSSR